MKPKYFLERSQVPFFCLGSWSWSCWATPCLCIWLRSSQPLALVRTGAPGIQLVSPSCCARALWLLQESGTGMPWWQPHCLLVQRGQPLVVPWSVQPGVLPMGGVARTEGSPYTQGLSQEGTCRELGNGSWEMLIAPVVQTVDQALEIPKLALEPCGRKAGSDDNPACSSCLCWERHTLCFIKGRESFQLA